MAGTAKRKKPRSPGNSSLTRQPEAALTNRKRTISKAILSIIIVLAMIIPSAGIGLTSCAGCSLF